MNFSKLNLKEYNLDKLVILNDFQGIYEILKGIKLYLKDFSTIDKSLNGSDFKGQVLAREEMEKIIVNLESYLKNQVKQEPKQRPNFR